MRARTCTRRSNPSAGRPLIWRSTCSPSKGR
jgi:hypothetical protein